MGCIGSCAAALCANCFCGAMGNICKTDSKNSRGPYIMTFLVWALASFVFALIPSARLTGLPFVGSSPELCGTACAGNGPIYRLGLCLVSFFALHVVILVIPGTGCFHWRGYFIKIILLSALTIWSFWWPNDPMQTYANVARWMSWVFIITQGYMLICWAYDTHDAMLARMEGDDGAEAEPNVKYAYLFICALLQIGSFVLIILFFNQYAGTGCGEQKFLLSVTIVGGIVATGISATEWCDHGNLFVSSVMMFYFTYLNFQAMATGTNAQCMSSWSEKAPMWIGFAVLICALSYIGYMGLNSDEKGELADADVESGDDKPTAEESNAAHNSPVMRKVNLWFHFGMLFGSFYVTMILSNWGSDQFTTGTDSVKVWSSGYKANTWLIASGEWLAMLLYVWTLVAPKLLSDREFG